MSSNYQEKYLKYKQKYLDLQKVIEGGSIINITKANIGGLVGRELIIAKQDFDKLGVRCEAGKYDKTYESSNPDFSRYKFRVRICGLQGVYSVIILPK